MSKGKLLIKFHKVGCGDCIYIRYESEFKPVNIFIDTGFGNTYKRTFRKDVIKIIEEGERIDLFIVTHTDADHIGGVKPFLNEFGIKSIDSFWFNHADKLNVKESNLEHEVSIKQGISLRDILLSNGVENKKVYFPHTYQIGNIKFKLLSPTLKFLSQFEKKWVEEEGEYEHDISKVTGDYDIGIEEFNLNHFSEDSEIENKSSIAFIMEIDNFRAMFCADAQPTILVNSLKELGYSPNNPINLNLLKVPHHGSKRNLSDDLLKLINCRNFVFSANGINRDKLPNKECVARIVRDSSRSNETLNLFFNHSNDVLLSISSDEEMNHFDYACIFDKQEFIFQL